MNEQHPPVVVVDPDILAGTPCLAGSRLPAQTLIAMVDSGDTWERIVASWPWLTPAHVDAARAWHLANNEGRNSSAGKSAGADARAPVRGEGVVQAQPAAASAFSRARS